MNRPVIKDNLISFLDSEQFRDAFPLSATEAIVDGEAISHRVNVEPLVNVIWQDEKVLVKTDVTLKKGSPLFIKGPKWRNGRLIFVLVLE